MYTSTIHRTNLTTAAATLAALTIGGAASADPINSSFLPDASVDIRSNADDINYYDRDPDAFQYNEHVFRLGFYSWGHRGNMRSVVTVDLNDHMPSGHDQITDFSLTLTSDGGFGGPADYDLSLYAITPEGDAGNEVVDTEMTWNDWRDSSPWTSGGGDFGSPLLVIEGGDWSSNSNVSTTFTSSSLVAEAQAALDEGRQLQLIAVLHDVEDDAQDSGQIGMAWKAITHDDVADRPTFEMTSVPEPGTVGLVLAGLGAMLLRRGRAAA